MTESTITAKGQTTVPRQVRDQIGAGPGTRLVWHVMPNGSLLVRAKTKSLLDLAGSLSSPDGTPVSQARIAFDGGMPQHGHGFPTQPRVTREIEPGVYALDGVKFSMTGWWDMRLAIQAGGVADTVVFNVIVEPGGVKR